MKMKIWMVTLAALFPYSKVGAAAPTALSADAPVLGASTYSHAVLEADRRMHSESRLNIEEFEDQQPSDSVVGALIQSPLVVTNQDNKLGPEVGYVPAYDLWHLQDQPLLASPGWIPTEGVFVGPGISFGLGFPVGYIGGFGWSKIVR